MGIWRESEYVERQFRAAIEEAMATEVIDPALGAWPQVSYEVYPQTVWDQDSAPQPVYVFSVSRRIAVGDSPMRHDYMVHRDACNLQFVVGLGKAMYRRVCEDAVLSRTGISEAYDEFESVLEADT